MKRFYLLLFLLAFGINESFSQKAGVVDVKMILDSIAERKVAIAEMEEMKKSGEKELNTLDSILTIMVRDGEYAGKKKSEEDIANFRERIEWRKKDLDKDLQQTAEETDQKSRKKVNEVALGVGKKMHLHGIYDKANPPGGSVKTVDITEQVLKEMLDTQ